ncbi:MAG: hypothetical protein K6T80_00910 [Firmicutes bacterium]|nr:hypothetical protein [Bacillota bacterium]
MLEMKAYYLSNEPDSPTIVYITNSPAIRKSLRELGIPYQGWLLDDGSPMDERKAPTLKIEAMNAAATVNPLKTELLIDLLNKNRYKLFTDFDNFTRLERFNKLPGRMLKTFMLMVLLWILWVVLSGR